MSVRQDDEPRREHEGRESMLAASTGLIVALVILVVVLVGAFYFVWKRAPRK
jgi:hypothetical protein